MGAVDDVLAGLVVGADELEPGRDDGTLDVEDAGGSVVDGTNGSEVDVVAGKVVAVVVDGIVVVDVDVVDDVVGALVEVLVLVDGVDVVVLPGMVDVVDEVVVRQSTSSRFVSRYPSDQMAVIVMSLPE